MRGPSATPYGRPHSGDTSRMDQRPYIIELEGVPAMPEAQRLEIVQFVFNELDAIYAGPWPVAMAMLAFMDEKPFAGLPWDKAWQVIELRNQPRWRLTWTTRYWKPQVQRD
jgi:hypothetical protein